VNGIIIVLSRRIDVCFEEEGKTSGREERNFVREGAGEYICVPHFDVHEQDWKRVEITLLFMYHGEMRRVLYKKEGQEQLSSDSPSSRIPPNRMDGFCQGTVQGLPQTSAEQEPRLGQRFPVAEECLIV
jgi:hypothetical protein